MELKKGQIVSSRRGRDVGRFYMVCVVKGDRVFLADGKKRTLAAPKPKNLLHINRTNTCLPASETENDIQLRKALAAYEAANSPASGG